MQRKQRTGTVVSDKMDKTVVVQIERIITHRLYRKSLRRRKRYQAHDERNDCRLGDRVLIEESRPLSKQKHWRVVEILDRHEVAEVQPREIAVEPEAIAPAPTPAAEPPAPSPQPDAATPEPPASAPPAATAAPDPPAPRQDTEGDPPDTDQEPAP